MMDEHTQEHPMDEQRRATYNVCMIMLLINRPINSACARCYAELQVSRMCMLDLLMLLEGEQRAKVQKMRLMRWLSLK